MADIVLQVALVVMAAACIALLCMDGDGNWRKVPEWLQLTLGVLGLFVLIALGLIGALLVIGHELFVPTRESA